jgi:hypothetical protein
MRILDYLKIWNIFRKTKNAVTEEVKNMETKRWWESRTVWFNVLSGLVGVITTLGESPLAADPKVKAGFTAFVGVGNIVLRLITDKPIV